ncbi:NAD-dependent epimerase/dehydratase family protein [Winogradskyella sp. PG-2]|uniref:NAD-dependent epimerase/dehydratase family protein n=1 Tax=Winogradskyella sp. PG-2 TaxID=754409 RepID=UPI0004586F8A|nr:NAD-dependent epimerase/dehydratase family protein [Winogradskyella sp. PG-2]BAO74408.1 UDP-glucose 4-epimerase [Winogradskyella sp. PG-2]
MNILIIGSKGFIGSHCVNYFSREHYVWQCDVGVDYSASNYTQVDATNADFTELFQFNKFDVCINCSGAASVPNSIENPQRDFMLNVVNVYKQLDAIRKYNLDCKYINLSSAAVYGNPKRLPINETHPLNPISPYGFHKKMSEEICKQFYDIYGLSTCSLRIFSAYGEGLKKQIFWDLYKKTVTNKRIELFGTGYESRDFIYVKDLVRSIDIIINNSDFKNDIVNIANGKELQIRYVVNEFYKYFPDKFEVTYKGENRIGDPINWVADISKLQSLGYEQNVKLVEGLNNYYQWAKENV